MKRATMKKLAAVAGCVTLICALDASVGYAAQDQVTTTAQVLTPMTIAKVVNLNFGKFMSGAAGTVVVGTDNSQTATGVTSTTALGAYAKAATFNVGGTPSATYAVSYPAQTTLTGPGTAMTIGSFTTAVDSGTVGTIPAGGTQVLSVGATLTVNAGQTAGTYGGTLDVAVDYN